MIRNDKTILSLSAALLLCFGALALAAPPDGKGGGKGNKPIDAFACFGGEILSNMTLQGEFIDNGGFDTLEGQLAVGEIITVGGDAGDGLAVLNSLHSILPDDEASVSVYPTGCEEIEGTACSVDFYSGVTWTVRLDRDKEPENRVQFKMRWVNAEGFERHLRIGWVVQAYEDEIYPLPDSEYGTVLADDTSLESATVTFETDFFRIDGKVPTGRGKKTELEVFSHYGEVYDASVAPWCNMGIPPTYHDDPAPCVASTIIQTDLKSVYIDCD